MFIEKHSNYQSRVLALRSVCSMVLYQDTPDKNQETLLKKLMQ